MAQFGFESFGMLDWMKTKHEKRNRVWNKYKARGPCITLLVVIGYGIRRTDIIIDIIIAIDATAVYDNGMQISRHGYYRV